MSASNTGASSMTDSIGDRLGRLRALMESQSVGAVLVPRSDEHLGEYVPPCAERLAYIAGFTGSAGLAVVLKDKAVLFVDGRYTEQAAQEADPAHWERLHLIDQPPSKWMKAHYPDAVIGYDPWLHSADQIKAFAGAGLPLRALERNPVDAIWADRPLPPANLAIQHPLERAGEASAVKRMRLAAALQSERIDAAIITDPASVAWLLNIRGADLPHLPVALAFALLRGSGDVQLFIDPRKITPEIAAWLGNGVTIAALAELPETMASLGGLRVSIDPANSPIWFAQAAEAAGATVVPGRDPCLLPKAAKNEAERAGAKAAHRRDAVAMCRFLHWLDNVAAKRDVTEYEAAAVLLGFRREVPGFVAESFPAISAAGAHAALPHYRTTDASNCALGRNAIYLIDSGGQYPDGTTDITRTIWIGPDAPPASLKEHYTLVLKGHIALARQCFPKGVSGAHLDSLARQFLWMNGLDYDHGTGHGVGSFLSVHEGPASISRAAKRVPLEAGMILSNEPGFYRSGAYGIRLENLVLVREESPGENNRPFLSFETISFAPFDSALVAQTLLTAIERQWLADYHQDLLTAIGPTLPDPARDWLRARCAPFTDCNVG